MIPLVLVVLAAAVAAVIMVTGFDYQIRRIVRFQRRRIQGVKGPAVLTMMESASNKAKVPLTDVRDLIISLQLGTSMEATMSGALAKAAEQFADRGVLGERLQRNVESRLSISPESVLEGLVSEIDCPQLVEVLDRIHMAATGGITYNRVLSVSASAIEEDIRAITAQQIQRAPIRLAPIMVAGVFLPALVLFMIPLIMSAFTQLAR